MTKWLKTGKDLTAHLEKAFGKDCEIVEAKEPLRLIPLTCDGDGAEPKSPFNCGFVHTAQRQLNSKGAVFWKSVAYIDFVDEDGIRRVHRYGIPQKTQAKMAAFDHGEPWIEGNSFLFNPAPKTRIMRRHGENVGGRLVTPSRICVHRPQGLKIFRRNWRRQKRRHRTSKNSVRSSTG
jgi:hypothetical protein